MDFQIISITQPSMPVWVASLIYFVTSKVVSTPQNPTTTPKFMLPPGRIIRKNVNYKTEAGKALYKQATRSLYSDSKGKFSLVSKGHLPLVLLLTVHAKLCGWDILDVPIATTGYIKEILVHYDEINLSYIKSQVEIINTNNDSRYQ